MAYKSDLLKILVPQLKLLNSSSVLYGVQDPGGVINIVTKKPQQTPKYLISSSLGSHNLWGTQLDFTGGLSNGFAYRFIYDLIFLFLVV